MSPAAELMALLRRERAAVSALDAEEIARTAEEKWRLFSALEEQLRGLDPAKQSVLKRELTEALAFAEANRALLQDAIEMVSVALGGGGTTCYDRRARWRGNGARGGRPC